MKQVRKKTVAMIAAMLLVVSWFAFAHDDHGGKHHSKRGMRGAAESVVLTQEQVQQVAEAFLLLHGKNHWLVSEVVVTEEGYNVTIASETGEAIHTVELGKNGRPRRLGMLRHHLHGADE